MSSKRIIMTGEKETFLVRVLVKKTKDSGIDCEYVPWNVNEINAKWKELSLIVLYIEDNQWIPEDTLHFLVDKMSEEGLQMIPIGGESEIQYVRDKVPADLIYKCFTRPVNNEEYTATITELFHKIDRGEFRKSVLIVDDDPNYLGLVREWLKGSYKVTMANSGLQAIKWLGKNRVDLILLDYEMPVTSGCQVLEMLRSDEETKDIPVMFLTGKSDKKSVMAVVDLKPEGYFLKSIEKDELLEKLDEFFRNKK